MQATATRLTWRGTAAWCWTTLKTRAAPTSSRQAGIGPGCLPDLNGKGPSSQRCTSAVLACRGRRWRVAAVVEGLRCSGRTHLAHQRIPRPCLPALEERGRERRTANGGQLQQLVNTTTHEPTTSTACTRPPMPTMQEQDPERKAAMAAIKDTRVDVCLYFIPPHRLRQVGCPLSMD